MKKIEDYLHLYLGCEVLTRDNYKTKLTAVYSDGTCMVNYNDVGETEEASDSVQPILRELSSMTEEEAIEVARLSEWEPHFRDVKVERNKYSDLIVTWQGSNESREMVNATGDCFYCAEQFQWLLKQGFDLFGLIESGLAISAPNPINEHSY